MSSDAHRGGATGHHPLDDVPTEHYEVFRDPRRVRLLAVLEEGTDDDPEQSVEALAGALAEREHEEGRQDVEVSATDETTGPRREIRISLIHDHLPRLADHGIVEWNRKRGTVTLRDDTGLLPASLTTLVETADDERDVLECVVDPVRLRLVDELADSSQPLSLEQLAAKLVSHDGASGMKQAKIALHHSHLPALEDAGVLEYDRTGELASLLEDVPPMFE